EAKNKVKLKERILKSLDLSLSGLCGLYGYFLCQSHDWLASDAISAWLMPSEFMDVNYGQELKNYLQNRVTTLRIHRFDPNEVQFNDALVSSAVVWFKNSLPKNDHHIEFSFGGSISHPKDSSPIPISILTPSRKWSQFPSRIDTTREG